jgi:tryptophanyl-tRNA synthetase
MSKSDPSDLSRINMTDDADTIAKKIQKAKTDPEPLPSDEKGFAGRPEAENLIGIYATLADKPVDAVLAEYGGRQFSAFKKELADALITRIEPIAKEIKRLTADPAEIDRILADGSARAREIASPIMDKVKDIVGFIRS